MNKSNYTIIYTLTLNVQKPSQNKYTVSQLITLFQGPGEKEVSSESHLIFLRQLFCLEDDNPSCFSLRMSNSNTYVQINHPELPS